MTLSRENTLRHITFKVCSIWEGLSTTNAIMIGLVLGVLLGIIPHVAFGWPVMIPGFLVYFPFHAWLCFLLFGVLLSRSRRSSIMGEGYSPLGAFIGYLLTTKYGLFCLSWFCTMWLYWVSVIVI